MDGQLLASGVSETEKDQIVRQILTNLDNTQQYLFRHPTLRLRSLERFLTATTHEELRASLNDTRPTRRASALLLLAASDDATVIEVALPIAIDRTRNDQLRMSAIAALVNAGGPGLVDAFIENLDEADPFYIHMLDCIGGIADASQLPRVLP